MANDRVRMERDTLRGTAGVLQRHEKQTGEVQDRMTQLEFKLEPDDPIQVHPNFLKAYYRFRNTWMLEIGLTGAAAIDVATELVITAEGLNDTDTGNGNRTPQAPDGGARRR